MAGPNSTLVLLLDLVNPMGWFPRMCISLKRSQVLVLLSPIVHITPYRTHLHCHVVHHLLSGSCNAIKYSELVPKALQLFVNAEADRRRDISVRLMPYAMQLAKSLL
jgi:hypothetical protein